MEARYRFAITVRLDVDRSDAWVDPARFETTFYTRAAEPGEEGWLFFRDYLWRGEVNDPAHLRTLLEEAIGVPVESVSLRAFETDREYLDALEAAIAADLQTFRAGSVDEVLSKYLGSAIEVE